MVKYAFVWTVCVLFLAGVFAAFSTEEPTIEAVNIEATAEFPDNPFGLIINGQRNLVILSLTNKGSESSIVTAISGRVSHADDPKKIIRNLTAIRQTVELPSKATTQVPFVFFSEFKPGEVDLTVFVDMLQNEEPVRLIGFNGLVAVTDPEISMFDPQMLFLYVVLGALFSGFAYIIRQTYFGGSKPTKARKKIAEPTTTPTHRDEHGNMILDQSWLPETSQKASPKAKKRTSTRNK